MAPSRSKPLSPKSKSENICNSTLKVIKEIMPAPRLLTFILTEKTMRSISRFFTEDIGQHCWEGEKRVQTEE
jgi:hypothetical protein